MILTILKQKVGIGIQCFEYFSFFLQFKLRIYLHDYNLWPYLQYDSHTEPVERC